MVEEEKVPAGRMLGPADPSTKACKADTGRPESTQYRKTIGACGGYGEGKDKAGMLKPG